MTANEEKARILIVEDEAIIAADLESRLKGLGYTVCGKATLAEKALDLIEQHQPDLVMMDIVLKGEMDGIETAEIVRSKWAIPVVFVTDYLDTDHLERAELAYPFNYILKPFQDGDLKITIETALYLGKVNDRLRQVEKQQYLSIKIFEILNSPTGGRIDLVRDILHTIKGSSGFEAVGIRLKEGEDFPYYKTVGFPDYFIEAEKYLCSRDRLGRVIRDLSGNPVLECMCGNIIRGRTDPSLPFFTAGGSFWSNCTTELLTYTTEEDRQARTRNRCNAENYESVGLIPLRFDQEIIGLLQLNDSRRGRFTSDMIEFFEGIGASIGIAIKRRSSEEERGRLIDELKSTLAEVKTLQGFLPICSNCKKIRDDEGYWQQIETYIQERSEAQFSHGICPDCVRKLYPDFYRG